MESISSIRQNMQQTMIAKATAEEGRIIQRHRKLTGPSWCQTLVLGWLGNPTASLENLAQFGMHVGLEISSQGLDKRFTQAGGEFLKTILLHMIEYRVVGESAQGALFDRFSHVYVEDSSIISLNDELADIWQGVGGSEGAPTSAVKLQVRLEMNHGELEGPYLVDGRTHDNKASREHHHTFRPNALYLRDLGYWHLDTLKKIGETEAYWLSRYKVSTSLLIDGTAQSIGQVLLNNPEDRYEAKILLGKTHQLPARLIALRVPKKVADERRRKAKRKYQGQGKTVSQERLALCDWNILVTNIPEEKLSFEEAIVLIRIRWQIELLFKLWKSHGQIDKSNSCNPWRQLCECYAKLIGMVLTHWLLVVSVWGFSDRSLTKAAQVIRSFALPFALALSNQDLLDEKIVCLKRSLAKHCRINRSKKTPRSFQLLENFEVITA